MYEATFEDNKFEFTELSIKALSELFYLWKKQYPNFNHNPTHLIVGYNVKRQLEKSIAESNKFMMYNFLENKINFEGDEIKILDIDSTQLHQINRIELIRIK